MAITGLQIAGKVSVDTKDAEAAIKRVGEQAEDSSGQKSGGGIKGMLGSMLSIAGGVGAVSLAAGGFNFLKDTVGGMIDAAREANKGIAQTNAVLASTHGVSGMTADSVSKLADHLKNLDGVDDDVVRGASNMLLTFTNIHSKTFPQATQTALDMAAALGGDATQSAMQLGKALNDPEKGITALQRVGVTFTEQQKQSIATMMKHGDVAGAQAVILKELGTEFGGSAKAAGDAAGPMNKLNLMWGDMQKAVGTALMPILNDLINKIVPLATQFGENLPGALAKATTWFNSNLKPTLQTIGTVLTTVLIPAVIGLVGKIGDFATFLQQNQPAMDAFKAILEGLGVAILISLVPAFIGWAISAGAAAVATIAATWPLLAIGAGIGLVILAIKLLIDHWGQITKTIGDFFSGVGRQLQQWLGDAGKWFGDLGNKITLSVLLSMRILGNFKDMIVHDVGGAFSGFGALVHGVWDGIVGVIKGGINFIIRDINTFIWLLDKIQIHIPSVGIGPVQTPAFNWNGLGIPLIPMLAAGGDVAEGGAAIVGDAGPELLTVNSRGARVTPLPGGLAGAAGAGGGQAIEIHNVITLDGRVLAQNVVKHIPAVVRNATGARNF